MSFKVINHLNSVCWIKRYDIHFNEHHSQSVTLMDYLISVRQKIIRGVVKFSNTKKDNTCMYLMFMKEKVSKQTFLPFKKSIIAIKKGQN